MHIEEQNVKNIKPIKNSQQYNGEHSPINTLDRHLKTYIKKTSKIKHVAKVILAIKNNPEFQYNFLFSNTYRKDIYLKINEIEKNKELFTYEFNNKNILFSFSDRLFIDLMNFKNKSYKFTPQEYTINPNKLSINYNGLFAPFGDFHYFPEVFTSRYILSPVFPCQFEDLKEKNVIDKMKQYSDGFNKIILQFILENNITEVAFNGMSVGCIKFALAGLNLIRQIEEINQSKDDGQKIIIKMHMIHPVFDLNKSGPYYINKKIKQIFRVNLKGFIGYFVFKKLPQNSNIILSKELNVFVAEFIWLIASKYIKIDVNPNIEFINKFIIQKNIKDALNFTFQYFEIENLKNIKDAVAKELQAKLAQLKIFALHYDDMLGAFNGKHCLFNVKINYSTNRHDYLDLEKNYIDSAHPQ